MKDVVIVSATRTPIGDFGGSLRDVPATSLVIVAIESFVKRAGIERKGINQVIMGNCFEPLDQNVARIAAVKAELPIETPAFTVVATCGSGMQAIICGVQGIRDADGYRRGRRSRKYEHCSLYPDHITLGPTP